jgi:hypothetical protein
MQPRPPADRQGDGGAGPDWDFDDGVPVDSAPRGFSARMLLVLWPAFMMAALLEALVFSVVDPTHLHGQGGDLTAWPATAIYSITFLLFWAVIATAAAITLWLDRPGPWQAD